jgi:CTP synthase
VQPKYIFVLGGGYSGLGKGIVVASISRLLQNFGLNVKPIKVDPYFNFGAGDQNPNEHGEVFVTEDGGEIDEDFGHYERFTAQPCMEKQNITSGKIYYNVIEKGKKGKFLGKNIQLIPHIRDEVKNEIRNVANNCDVAVVEVGGTIGDDEALVYMRAIPSMIYEDNENTSVVVLVPVVFNESVGEPKTKVAQNAIRALNELGLRADFLVVRTQFEDFVDEKRREKFQTFCNCKKENIIVDPDLDSAYRLPFIFNNQQLGEKIAQKFGLKVNTPNWNGYDEFIKKMDNVTDRIPIAYIGKYVAEGKGIHKDAYISVEEALKRACIEFGFLPEIHRIDAVQCEKSTKMLEKVVGIVVPGGYGIRGLEGKMNAIKYARENGIPYLGLCLGLQLGIVEFAKNVCGIEIAHHDETDEGRVCIDPTGHAVCIMPEQEKIREVHGYFGTQRLGDYACALEKGFVRSLYERVGRPDEYEKAKLQRYDKLRIGNLEKDDFIVFERHRHRREVNPSYHDILLKNGMQFPGIHRSLNGTILVEIISLKDHPFYVASQFHPEFTSNYSKPNPLFYGFAEAVKTVAFTGIAKPVKN